MKAFNLDNAIYPLLEARTPNRIGIIGVGNPTMGDDGVGVRVLELLKKESVPENVSIIDIGTSGLSLLHALPKFDVAVIVDAVDFGGSPGETCSFAPDDAESIRYVSGLSAHECHLLNIIKISKELLECPKMIMIFAIQPVNIVASMELSSSLQKALPRVMKDILGIIHSICNSECSLQKD